MSIPDMTHRAPSIEVDREVGAETDEFLAPLLADEELLRAEFEAIIATGWPAPPDQTRQMRIVDDDRPSGFSYTRPVVGGEEPRSPGRREREPARERSPPSC